MSEREAEEEAKEVIRKLHQNPIEAQVRAAIAACVAAEMRAGRSRDEAYAICYARLRQRADHQIPPPQTNHEVSAKNGKLCPNPKELPTLTKRGICIYILEVYMISGILKDLFTLLEKGTFIFKKKLSPDKSIKIMREVASYIYFETVKQIWEYQQGNLCQDDARQLLDAYSTYFGHSYGIHNLADKLEEYRKVRNPAEHVAKNIQNVVQHRDIRERFLISVHVGGLVANPEFNLFDCIGEMFKLSDGEMAEIIEEFFLTVYPKLVKQ